MRRSWAIAIPVEESSEAVICFPGPSRPGRRIRRILHNISRFDPDSSLITLRGTFGLPLFSGADPKRSVIRRSLDHAIEPTLLGGWIMKAPALSLSAALAFILVGAPLMDAAKANFGICERPFEELGTGQSSD
jgi:hypothetical protein